MYEHQYVIKNNFHQNPTLFLCWETLFRTVELSVDVYDEIQIDLLGTQIIFIHTFSFA